MSSRRKRAPPVRVDEEDKKRLNWNMLEDRKAEAVQDEDPVPTRSVLPNDPCAGSSFSATTSVDAPCSSVHLAEELPGTSSDSAAASATLALTVEPASKLANLWKALIGEFSVRLAWTPTDCQHRAFVLHRVGSQLRASYSSCDDGSASEWRPGEDGTCTAVCSLTAVPLEDLDWMQKRRVVQLCHQEKEGSVKVRRHPYLAVLVILLNLTKYVCMCLFVCLAGWDLCAGGWTGHA